MNAPIIRTALLVFGFGSLALFAQEEKPETEAEKVALAVADGLAPLGILVCGSGQGMCMAANKVSGVRAAVCSDTFSAHAVREHNDANVLCLGQRVVGPGLAQEIVDTFLDAEFEGGRHARRVGKIMDLEGR